MNITTPLERSKRWTSKPDPKHLTVGQLIRQLLVQVHGIDALIVDEGWVEHPADNLKIDRITSLAVQELLHQRLDTCYRLEDEQAIDD